MRTIPQAALNELSTNYGTEPIIIVEIQWQENIFRYADRAFEGCEGRILSIDGLDDLVNISSSSVSQSASFTLDDSDGALKTIFNNVDMHRKKVWIYQWFPTLAYSDRILIFSGVIVSPVIWKEGDRTLTLNVLTDTNAREVGFSAEDGNLDVPQKLIGQAWPLVFGTVSGVSAVLVDEIKGKSADSGSGDDQGSASDVYTTTNYGVPDPSLRPKINDNLSIVQDYGAMARAYFIGYLQAAFTAESVGEKHPLRPLDPKAGPYSSLAQQYLDKGNEVLRKNSELVGKTGVLQNVLGRQESYSTTEIGISDTSKFPLYKRVQININGTIFTGTFIPNKFLIESAQHPAERQYRGLNTYVKRGQPVIPRNDFHFIGKGASVKLIYVTPSPTTITNPLLTATNPIRYIIAGTVPVTVLSLSATRNGVVATIPSSYYVVYPVQYGTMSGTMVVFPTPLSLRQNSNGESEGWQDDVYATVRSSVGPNTVDIMRWLIENYTDCQIDEQSFNTVRELLEPYPSSFAITDRPNVLNLLKDIAYRARCMIWLKNNVFYLKFLPKKDPPVATITLDDIEENTLEIMYTDTEDVVTKLIAEWRSNNRQSKPNLVILRYNIDYYGVQEERTNWFIYNRQQFVEKAATFWLIRKANVYKKVRFTTNLSKLNIEAMDTVTLDLGGLLANTPIDCFVEEAKIDSDNYSITFLCWCPVRAGEMTEYLFAYPADLEVQNVFPTPDDIRKGRPGAGKKTPSTSDVKPPVNVESEVVSAPFSGAGNLPRSQPASWGQRSQREETEPPLEEDIPEPPDFGGNTAPDVSTYVYETEEPFDTNIEPFPDDTVDSSALPGYIISKESGDTYVVDIYPRGLNQPPERISNVKVLQVDPTETWEEGTGVIVVKVKANEESDDPFEYYMQPPVWQ
jgi:hypothetical protein